MSGMKWDEMTAEERLLAEQVVLNFRELNRACDAARDGAVLGVCETLALRQGRELMRRTIESALHLQKSEVEKKESGAGLWMWADEAASRLSSEEGDDRCGGSAVVAGVLRVPEMFGWWLCVG